LKNVPLSQEGHCQQGDRDDMRVYEAVGEAGAKKIYRATYHPEA